MKKIVIPITLIILTVFFVSVAMADGRGKGKGNGKGNKNENRNGDQKAGELFLFQKCDATLIPVAGHDSLGCPNEPGPWPVFPDNRRWGKMNYTLWGDEFKFSFEGKRLLPNEDYTLIYYPDPWPGSGLICLGSGTSNPAGNIEIHGSRDIGTGLPASYDANFKAVPNGSGAVGAKIWLAPADDVKCTNGSSNMLNWNPTAYLFEYNLIVYERREVNIDEDSDDDSDDD